MVIFRTYASAPSSADSASEALSTLSNACLFIGPKLMAAHTMNGSSGDPLCCNTVGHTKATPRLDLELWSTARCSRSPM